MHIRYIVVLTAILLFGFLTIHADEPKQPEGDSKAIREVLDQAIATINKKDVDGNMLLMHPESPNYQATLLKTKAMLDKYDVTAEILDYDFIGTSGDYAFVRIRQKNTMRTGGFKGTAVELVHSLKKNQGKWRFWSIMQLSMEIEK